ncbi:MAG: hypothetical protein VKL98_09730 [Cyanobacteriota bacterium]|nr:hypothetical protein [Cyanobacteriota bacterium]
MLKWFKDRGAAPGPPNGVAPGPPNYEVLVKAIAARAQQQVSWQQIQAYLRNRDLAPEQLAQWMTRYGGALVQAADPAVGEGLVRLGQIAEGELAAIARLLGEAIVAPQPAAEVESQAEAGAEGAAQADLAPPPAAEAAAAAADSEVLDQVAAYLRGDFSFADPEGPGPPRF